MSDPTQHSELSLNPGPEGGHVNPTNSGVSGGSAPAGTQYKGLVDDVRDGLLKIRQRTDGPDPYVDGLYRDAIDALASLEEQLEALRIDLAVSRDQELVAIAAASEVREQYAALERAAAVLVAQPFGSLDQRAFYALREFLASSPDDLGVYSGIGASLYEEEA